MERTSRPAAGAGGGIVAVLLVFFALVLVIGSIRRAPPSPRAASAPPGEFSAERAEAVLQGLLAGVPPHPVGSPGDARVRERLLASLRGMGLEPQIQEGFRCHGDGTCAAVRNVMARLPGREPGGAVLLDAHYDSMGASPGAGDDGAGVATLLEVLRALAVSPPARNPLIVLFDEGEEAGLLGAEVFAEEHPWARQVRAVVNLEARGSSGPSLMFETGGGNASIMRLFAGAAPRPVTSSVFSALYALLPNDTNFTVFKRRGLTGFNFAFIGDGSHYHTAADTLANLSPATLQHQGDNVLAVARALSQADLGQLRSGGGAVFFDLFAWRTVVWPVAWMRVLALLVIALLAVDLALLIRRGGLRPRALLAGLTAWCGMVLGTLAVAFVVSLLLSWSGAFPNPQTSPWLAHPLPAEALFWLLALAVVTAVGAGAARRAGGQGLWAGIWTWWSLLGALLAWQLPAASYPLLLPALVAGLTMLIGLLGSGGRRHEIAATVLPAAAAALLGLPILALLYDGLGAQALFLISTLVGLLATTMAPQSAALAGRRRRAIPSGAGAAAALLLVPAFLLPPFSPRSPRGLDLIFYQDADRGAARWVVETVGGISPALRSAAPFSASPQPAFAWSSSQGRFYVAPTAPLPLAPPEIAILEQSVAAGKRRLRFRLSSPRGAADLRLILPRSIPVEAVTAQGKTMPAPFGGQGHGRLRQLNFLGMPPSGVEVEIVLGTMDKVTVLLRDDSTGLPTNGDVLRRTRSPREVPFDAGDLTIVSRSAAL